MKFEFDTNKGQILVVVKVSAYSIRGEVTLALDTGADVTVIEEHFLREFGFDTRSGVDGIKLTTASGYGIARKLVVPNFRALGKTRRNFALACYTFPKSIGVDGVLGLDFFRGFDLNINFKTGQIHLK